MTRPARAILERQWASEPAPGAAGALVALVRRLPRGPLPDGTRRGSSVREVLHEAELTMDGGLIGDRWREEERDVQRQLTVMEARSIRCLVGGPDLLGAVAWQGPGDNLVVDFDLSEPSLPIGSRFAVGAVVLEVTRLPHLGCKKFEERYGAEALAWVNSDEGRRLRLRGLNARVVRPGAVRIGDLVAALAAAP